MAGDLEWRSEQGGRTGGNRDCGGIGLRGDDILCIVLDGSTNGRDSGPFAREIARAVVDRFVDGHEAIDVEAITRWLRAIHGQLARRYPQASASYVLVHVDGSGAGLALHAGDCLLGRWDGEGEIEWLSRPDTLANALNEASIVTIASQPSRHRLTRSFRAKESRLNRRRLRPVVRPTGRSWPAGAGAVRRRGGAG